MKEEVFSSREKELNPNFFKQGNVSLILEGYNDLFSDFDPRPTSERGISVDFLDECRRAVRDKEKGTEIRLLLPKSKRNSFEEGVIKRRLKEHFIKHFNEKRRDVKKIKLAGWAWFSVGVFLTLISAFLLEIIASNYLFNVLLVIIEPAGWFFFWEGLYKVFITSKEKMPEYEFYQKMSLAKISFHSY